MCSTGVVLFDGYTILSFVVFSIFFYSLSFSQSHIPLVMPLLPSSSSSSSSSLYHFFRLPPGILVAGKKKEEETQAKKERAVCSPCCR
jgi:hypothetical protein